MSKLYLLFSLFAHVQALQLSFLNSQTVQRSENTELTVYWQLGEDHSSDTNFIIGLVNGDSLRIVRNESVHTDGIKGSDGTVQFSTIDLVLASYFAQGFVNDG